VLGIHASASDSGNRGEYVWGGQALIELRKRLQYKLISEIAVDSGNRVCSASAALKRRSRRD